MTVFTEFTNEKGASPAPLPHSRTPATFGCHQCMLPASCAHIFSLGPAWPFFLFAPESLWASLLLCRSTKFELQDGLTQNLYSGDKAQSAPVSPPCTGRKMQSTANLKREPTIFAKDVHPWPLALVFFSVVPSPRWTKKGDLAVAA